jgi:hypothetical protein
LRQLYKVEQLMPSGDQPTVPAADLSDDVDELMAEFDAR